MSDTPIIVLFRQDLRVDDHPALTAAVEAGVPVVPLYVLDDDAAGKWRLGSASRWWLHTSLERLAEALAQRGAPSCCGVARRSKSSPRWPNPLALGAST